MNGTYNLCNWEIVLNNWGLTIIYSYFTLCSDVALRIAVLLEGDFKSLYVGERLQKFLA
jgi:hypothetical protein